MQNLSQDGHEELYYQTLFTERRKHGREPKVPPGAIGRACTRHTAVTIDEVSRNSVSPRQIFDELSQRLHLRVRG